MDSLATSGSTPGASAVEPTPHPSDAADSMDRLCRQLAKTKEVSWHPSVVDTLLTRLKNSDGLLRAAKRRSIRVVLGHADVSQTMGCGLENDHSVGALIDRLARSILELRSQPMNTVLTEDCETVYRIDQFALRLVAHLQAIVDEPAIVYALTSYQRYCPLQFAELWALRDLLFLALIELLATAAGLVTSDGRLKPPRFATSRTIGACHAPPAVIVMRCIDSLRLLEDLRWRNIVDATCLAERILSEDPSEHYARMHFVTRSRYHQALTRLSRTMCVTEMQVARAALTLSRTASSGAKADRRTHVGYYLIDEGVEVTCAAVGGQLPRPSTRKTGSGGVNVHAYLLAQVVAPTVLTIALLLAMFSHLTTPLTIALLFIPTWLAVTFVTVPAVNAIVASLARGAAPLPRMDYRSGIPESARTWIVIPCILENSQHARSLVEGLRIRFLANRLANVSFALLTDLPDADTRTLASDEQVLQVAIEGIQQLNQEYASRNAGMFYLLHRERKWNEAQKRWMGYERKRGKLNALNAFLLRGERDAFSILVGAIDRLSEVRYVITLDSDTRLPWGAARRLIETIDHPLNRPELSSDGLHVVAGYSIIQPRISVLLPMGRHTRYARLFAQVSDFEQYSQASTDFHYHLFGESPYVGKGIYDVRAFDRMLADRFPENSVLSHDLLEGCFARAATAADIEVHEDFPLTYAIESARRARWIRGDWQIARWLAARVPVPGGRVAPNTLSPISKWKLFNSLRESLRDPVLFGLLMSSWLTPVIPPQFAALIAFPLMVSPLTSLGHELRRRTARGGAVRAPLAATLWPDVGRALFAAACLPHSASIATRAIAKTAWRAHISHRNLLEWTTFDVLTRQSRLSAGAHNAARNQGLLATNLIAWVVTAVLLYELRPECLAVAGPWLCLWALAPILDAWSTAIIPINPAALVDGTSSAWPLPDCAPAMPRCISPPHASLPDDEFLDQVQRAAFLFFWEQASPTTGQVRDRALAAGGDARRVSSIAATGFGLTALCIGDARGYADATQIKARVATTLTFLSEQLTHVNGFYYHFLDTDTGARVWSSEVSSIDTSILLCGVLTCRQHFQDSRIQALASAIYNRVNWPWMLNGGLTFSTAWTPERGFGRARWDTYSELLMIYLLAIGSSTNPVPVSTWDAFARPFFTYGGLTYISNLHAPLFIHQYSHAWFDFRAKHDKYADYFANSVVATQAHKRFCLSLRSRFKGYQSDLWGLTTSDSETGYTLWGGPPAMGSIDGSIVPCAAGGSLPFLPHDCIAVLRNILRLHPQAWKRYGFVDAFNPLTSWVDHDVVGINAGIVLLMAENRRSGFVWKTFMRNPEVQRALFAVGLQRASRSRQ